MHLSGLGIDCIALCLQAVGGFLFGEDCIEHCGRIAMKKYCYVFFVTHKYFIMVDAEGDDVNEVKEIGVYASHQLAKCAVQRFAK